MYQLNLNIIGQIMFHEIIQLKCMCVINLHYAKVAFCIASNSRKYNKTLFFYIFWKHYNPKGVSYKLALLWGFIPYLVGNPITVRYLVVSYRKLKTVSSKIIIESNNSRVKRNTKTPKYKNNIHPFKECQL